MFVGVVKSCGGSGEREKDGAMQVIWERRRVWWGVKKVDVVLAPSGESAGVT